MGLAPGAAPPSAKKQVRLKMNKIKVLLCLMVFLLVTGISTASNIIYVAANGPNDPGSGTYEDPFRRIQAGINAAANGDTVEIQPGLYTGLGNYNLDPNGKVITIRSIDPKVAANTIIDPNKAGRGFYFHSGEDANCVISGLTIKNAYTAEIGAGIYCYKSNPTISYCILMNNHAEEYGGAICCEESNSLFENCTISGNDANDGGGIECWTASPRLVNCIISNNHAVRYGGGVDCYNRCDPCLVNCDLINNIAAPNGLGGAICLWGSDISIKNSILWANEAKTGAQVYLQFKSSVSVSYCDVQRGLLDVCAPDSNVSWGSGNIDADPCFASFYPNGDPNLWDLHLQSKDGRWNN
jgi:predicted outer membrane repeat protein